MALRKSKIYKLITNGTREALIKGMQEYLLSGKSPNLKDPETGGTLLHHIVNHSERFRDPETLTIVYMLACKDVEIDAQDNYGDTPLHKVVRVNGAHKLLIAFMRIGADSGVKNNQGLTAEDILLTEKPDGWQTNLHFYNKYKPGLWQALQAEEPDRKLIERLLKSWCRLTSMKNGKVADFKTLIANDVKKTDLLILLEKYENSIELALALIGGLGHDKNCDPDFIDIAHEQFSPQRSVAPQPLLAATWETNRLSAVEVLMDLKPDTNILYSTNPPVIPPKPLYFHLFECEYRPSDVRIIERIFKDCDFTLKNYDGQTILYELIKRNESDSLFKFVLSKNINLAARDLLGRTARDFAEEFGRLTHRRYIDEHIFKLIKTKQLETIEKMVIHNYNHLHDIKDSSGKTTEEYAKRHSTKQIQDIVKLTLDVQKYCRRIFQAVEEDMIDDLQKLLSCKKYAGAKEKCGKTILLKALMFKRREMVLYIIRNFDFIINECDNLGRSPLHYANLFMDEPEVIDELERHGANRDLADVRGVKPIKYSHKICGNQEYLNLIKQVEDLHLNIYIHETHFDSQFRHAIQEGEFDAVQRLLSDALPHGDLTRYSSVLFDCIDNEQGDIAVFLIMSGFKTDIYKQYNKCDPSNPMCAMMECGHVMTSFKERAKRNGCKRVIHLMEEQKKESKKSTKL
ncbi:hypothetical protein LOTGIDRAFT_232377 [Lottia gigantea]|uniref:Uncharacterized protein n=1 Tax=Lottia gigantea TaxID=225164 RepID=V4BZJ4_LOTGI|nr:hypothetical protein LOTGIDRAFT_232377 [Lottia gigantea]ESO94574.1 hypothetical protein LOTGIDRAFT_232377 [Lottia gigantea]